MGEERRFDQVNCLSSRGSSMRDRSLMQSLKTWPSAMLTLLFFSWDNQTMLKSPAMIQGMGQHRNREELLQKSGLKFRRRSIDISDKKADVGVGHCEIDRDGVRGGWNANAGERHEGPIGKDAIRAPKGSGELKGIQLVS